MEIGTAIFVIAIIGFMIVSPGFRIVALCCVVIGIAGFFWIGHIEDQRYEQRQIEQRAADCDKNNPFRDIECGDIKNRGH